MRPRVKRQRQEERASLAATYKGIQDRHVLPAGRHGSAAILDEHAVPASMASVPERAHDALVGVDPSEEQRADPVLAQGERKRRLRIPEARDARLGALEVLVRATHGEQGIVELRVPGGAHEAAALVVAEVDAQAALAALRWRRWVGEVACEAVFYGGWHGGEVGFC